VADQKLNLLERRLGVIVNAGQGEAGVVGGEVRVPDLGGVMADDLPDRRLVEPATSIANRCPAIVNALPYPDPLAMLVTNAVAALANGYGGYDSGKDSASSAGVPRRHSSDGE
jgi:hypothetical protein